MKIALITAMQSEYDAVASLYHFDKEGRAFAHNHELILIKSGIGKVNAALAAEKACALKVDLVINTGLAGGIDSRLSQGDVVLADKTCYHDVWCGEPNEKGQVQDFPLYYESPVRLLEGILSATPEFQTGLVVTGDVFLTDVTRLKEIKSEFKEALAVDMESAAVAQTCYIRQTPYLSLRIISDVVGKETQMNDYDNFWQNVPQKATQMVDTVLKNL